MKSTRAAHNARLLAVLLIAPFMAQVDATIANVATPAIHADLGASGAALQLVIGGYLIAFAVLLISGARLGQTHGYRRIFVLGVSVFTLASLLCAVAPSPIVLIVGRVIQGAGAALMFPQALSGIQLNFSGRHRARAIGLYALALSGGAVVGQILGGALISADIAGSGWRAIFLINVPVGAGVLIAALRYLPVDRHRGARRLDLPGVATLSAAMLLFVVPLVVGHSEGWPVWTWAALAASLPAFGLFFAVERRITASGGSPLINVRVLARPAVGWALVTLLAATGTYYALLFTLAQYLQQGLGHSPLVSGLTLVPWVAAFGAAGQLMRRLPPRMTRLAPCVGCLLLAGSYVAISAVLFNGDVSELLLVVLLGAGGLGLGIQFSGLIAHLISAVPTEYAADISGVSSTTVTIGGSIGVAALGTVYLSLVSHAGPAHATHAFAITTSVFATVALLASIAAYRATLTNTPRTDNSSHPVHTTATARRRHSRSPASSLAGWRSTTSAPSAEANAPFGKPGTRARTITSIVTR
jgi:EmrB/QacA subfamily drug resistance transporter